MTQKSKSKCSRTSRAGRFSNSGHVSWCLQSGIRYGILPLLSASCTLASLSFSAAPSQLSQTANLKLDEYFLGRPTRLTFGNGFGRGAHEHFQNCFLLPWLSSACHVEPAVLLMSRTKRVCASVIRSASPAILSRTSRKNHQCCSIGARLSICRWNTRDTMLSEGRHCGSLRAQEGRKAARDVRAEISDGDIKNSSKR